MEEDIKVITIITKSMAMESIIGKMVVVIKVLGYVAKGMEKLSIAQLIIITDMEYGNQINESHGFLKQLSTLLLN